MITPHTRTASRRFAVSPALCLLAVALSVPAAGAATRTALTWENIFATAHGARQSAISPDGSVVAVAGATADRSGIFLVPTTGQAEARFWVDGSAPVWFPDGKTLLFARANDLWTVAMGSSDAKPLTHDAQDERAAQVSPDGKWVAFYSGRSGSQDIWLVAADGASAPRQLTKAAMAADDFRFAPAWSPDSRTIAYVSNAADYWADDVWIVDVASGAAKQLSHGLMAMSTPVWSPNGREIGLLGTAKSGYWYEDLSEIFVVNAADGAERTVKMQVFGTDWLHSQPIFWSADGAQIFFIYMQRGDFNLWVVPSAGGVATRVTNLVGAIRSIDATARTDAFAFIRTGPTRGPEVEYIKATGGPTRRLTAMADDWEGLVEPQEVAYRSFDGLYIQGFLFLPPGMKEGGRYPALVMVHGGGTNSYLNTLNLNEQYMASKGYVVLAINYRGGSGFGRQFQDLSINDWANGQARDAAAAADFVRALPYVSGKVGIYGYSYGGIMTMATIARAPGKFDAAVPMAGIYDFGDAYTNADRVGKIFIRTGHGGSPEERKEVYAISNTLARVPNVTTPLLIMHGEADVRAPFRQYQLAVDILKKNGKTFESKTYPNEPHGFRNPANRVDMYQRMEAFFDRYLKTSGTASR